MEKTRLTATIITLNEEENLPRALDSLKWVDEILVVDCGSIDQTIEIAKSSGAKVLHNAWVGYGQQKNFAQHHSSNDWILNIDADEVISPELAHEIQMSLIQIRDGRLKASGFAIPRKTFYLGRWIRKGGWYPNYLVRLSHKQHARWTEPNVHEQLIVEGPVLKLRNPIHHYTFRTIQDQVLTNVRYSRQGSTDLKLRGVQPSWLKLIYKPIGKFVETYFIKQGFRDGIAGFIISINAAHSIFLKYAYLFEERIKDESTHHR